MHHDEHASVATAEKSSQTNGFGLLLLTIVAVLLALFCWYMWKSGSKEADHYRFAEETAMHEHEAPEGEEAGGAMLNPAELGSLDTTTGNFIFNVGDNIKITLPDSAHTVLEVGANSTEAKLYKFLTDASVEVNAEDKTQGWITCDRIYFETGKAALTADSKKQISNIAAILKAFPAAELKVGGYTDNTGSAEINEKLSADRAAAVKNAIEGLGASNATASEGYGPLHPIASNETAEGKALNRRTDLRVTKK